MNSITFSVPKNDFNHKPLEPLTVNVSCDNDLSANNAINDYTKYALSLANKCMNELELTGYPHIPCPSVSLNFMDNNEVLEEIKDYAHEFEIPVSSLLNPLLSEKELPDTTIKVSLDATDCHEYIGGYSQPHVLLALKVLELLETAIHSTGMPVLTEDDYGHASI